MSQNQRRFPAPTATIVNATRPVCFIRLELSVPDAKMLKNILVEFGTTHPTDPIYQQLTDAIRTVESEELA